MKPKSFPAPVLMLAICTLLIASCASPSNNNAASQNSAIFATSAADGGHLVINPSPILGDNVFLTIRVDGELAGTLMPTGSFDRYIKPGRRVVKVSPNRAGSDAWQATLNVRAGQTYSYVVSYDVNKLVLTRVTGSR
jgi:hypothetical protein